MPPIVKRGTLPIGIVLVHDITGRDAANLHMADKFQAAGFWVAAIDLFQGKTAPNLDEGMKLRAGLTNEHRVAQAKEALLVLREAMGPAAKIGVLGFCMGGGAALQAACALPLAFCVDYYGRIDNAADVAGMTGNLLFIEAKDDAWINGWLHNELQPTMAKHARPLALATYGGKHAFHREGWPAYNRASADAAFARAVEFMQRAR